MLPGWLFAPGAVAFLRLLLPFPIGNLLFDNPSESPAFGFRRCPLPTLDLGRFTMLGGRFRNTSAQQKRTVSAACRRNHDELDRLRTTEPIRDDIWKRANEGRPESSGKPRGSEGLGRSGDSTDGGEHAQAAEGLHPEVLKDSMMPGGSRFASQSPLPNAGQLPSPAVTPRCASTARRRRRCRGRAGGTHPACTLKRRVPHISFLRFGSRQHHVASYEEVVPHQRRLQRAQRSFLPLAKPDKAGADNN